MFKKNKFKHVDISIKNIDKVIKTLTKFKNKWDCIPETKENATKNRHCYVAISKDNNIRKQFTDNLNHIDHILTEVRFIKFYKN